MTSRRLFPAGLLATTLTIAASACAVSVAHAADPTWLPAVTLSDTSQFALSPLGAAAPDGTATVVWKQGPQDAQYLYASTRTPDAGEWSTPQQISADGEYVNEARIAVGGDGNTTVVWNNNGGSSFLKARTYMRATGWSPTTQTLDTNPGGMAIAAGDDGLVTVAFATYTGSDHVVRTVTRSAGSDVFDGDLVDVTSSPTVSVWDPSLAYNAHGDGIVMWRVDLGGSDRGLRTARYDHATKNRWSDSAPVGHSANGISSASVAIDDAGNAAAFWGTNDHKSAGYGAAMNPATGEWGPSTKLSTGANGSQATDPDAVAADNHGNFVAVWQEWAMTDPDTPDFTSTHVQTSTYNVADESWSPSQYFAGQALGGAPSVEADAAGNIVAVLGGTTDMEHFQYLAFSRPPGGTFSDAPGVVLPDRAGPWSGVPDVTTDTDGNFYATFGQTDFMNPSQGEVAFAVADAAGPSLGSLSFQTSGGVDEDFSFSVSPLDAWSALGATTWSFGDDTSASGTSVSHRFASAGTYTVTATSTDALGNSSSESQTVTVTAPPTPPAPPEIRKEQIKLPPVIPARLAGKKITITTTVPNCSAKFIATTKFGTTKYQTKLKLTQTGKTCTATGTIVLKKTPSTRTKLRVTIGRVTKRGTSTIKTLTTKRG